MQTETGSAEIARIRAEYERRRREIPRDFYSWAHDVNFFFHCQTARAAIQALTKTGRFPLEGRNVLDAGCGSGVWLLEMAQWGADRLHGIDVDSTRIDTAKQRLPGAELHCGDARQLPWPDATFDVISQFTMFTSILDKYVKQAIAAEMLRTLKPDGVILWYDFRLNNPANPNVRGIASGEIRALFPNCEVGLRPVTLAPPIARQVVPLSWSAACLLESIPLLRTHYMGLIQNTSKRNSVPLKRAVQ